MNRLSDPTRSRLSAGFLAVAPVRAYGASVMFSMFVIWVVVFLGIFRRWRWIPLLALVALVWTVVLLKMHVTSPIPLEF